VRSVATATQYDFSLVATYVIITPPADFSALILDHIQSLTGKRNVQAVSPFKRQSGPQTIKDLYIYIAGTTSWLHRGTKSCVNCSCSGGERKPSFVAVKLETEPERHAGKLQADTLNFRSSFKPQYWQKQVKTGWPQTKSIARPSIG
jgi:hypothetical protein